MDDRSRRNNLRIDVVDEKPSKTWDECEARVQELIEVNLGRTDTIEFEKYHRISAQTNSSKNQNRSRTITCKATKFRDKQKILKSDKCLKDTGIFIYQHFCQDTMDLRKKLWNKLLEYDKQNKFAYLNYRSIVVREHGRDRAVRQTFLSVLCYVVI